MSDGERGVFYIKHGPTFTVVFVFNLQERAGVKMVMIQDGPQNTGADKPLRISGEPFKVQVGVILASDLWQRTCDVHYVILSV